MEDIVAAASDLGKRIAAHPRTKAFMTAAKAIEADSESLKLLQDYQRQLERVRERERSGAAIEPEDKRKLADLEQRSAGNEKLRALMRTQADYLDLMSRVNQAIDVGVQA